MTNKESIIKGLESLHDRLMDAAEKNAIATLDASMVADALALLKEQDECENCAVAIEDRQPVVRCRDCKHAVLTSRGEAKYCQFWQEDEDGNFGGDPLYLDGDFFCAGGERR